MSSRYHQKHLKMCKCELTKNKIRILLDRRDEVIGDNFHTDVSVNSEEATMCFIYLFGCDFYLR